VLALSFLWGYAAAMMETRSLLTATEVELKKRFSKEESDKRRLPSVAANAPAAERIDQLVLPDNMRAKMPVTKDKYLVKENPHLVEWEREVRKFLRNLTPEHGHRVAAVMVYEWATGVRVADLMKDLTPMPSGRQNWRTDLRKINKVLTWYFGKPYMTYICGRKVPNCYRVRPGYYIRRHRPFTLTLWAEYQEGVLYP
jgi:hypothetical protein